MYFCISHVFYSMCVLNFIIYTHSLCNCPIPIIVTKRSYHHHHHRCHHQDDDNDDKSCGYCKDFTMLFHRHFRIDCCSSVHFGIFPSKCVRRVPTAVDATLLHDNQLARVRTCICVGENAVMPLHHCGCCCEQERVRSNPALFLADFREMPRADIWQQAAPKLREPTTHTQTPKLVNQIRLVMMLNVDVGITASWSAGGREDAKGLCASVTKSCCDAMHTDGTLYVDDCVWSWWW